MKNPFALRASAIITALMFATLIARSELMVGNKAPELQTGKWVQGEPIQVFDTNHVYIVEFWATWCAPCARSIPVLNNLWQKFKDKGAIVIGQDIWDTDDKVAPFVKKEGDQMTYQIALDDKSQIKKGAMAVNWMDAAKRDGIPTAFIINQQGLIAWIGSPEDLNEPLLNDIVSGHYDFENAKTKYALEFEKYTNSDALFREETSYLKKQEWDAAASTLDKILITLPEQKAYWSTARLQILLGQKKYDAACQLASSLNNQHPNDPYRQNGLAWILVTQGGAEQCSLKLAEKLAEQANLTCAETNAAVLDTLARVQFVSGKTNAAVATEQKALETAPDEHKNSLKETLTDYQQGKLPEAN